MPGTDPAQSDRHSMSHGVGEALAKTEELSVDRSRLYPEPSSLRATTSSLLKRNDTAITGSDQGDISNISKNTFRNPADSVSEIDKSYKENEGPQRVNHPSRLPIPLRHWSAQGHPIADIPTRSIENDENKHQEDPQDRLPHAENSGRETVELIASRKLLENFAEALEPPVFDEEGALDDSDDTEYLNEEEEEALRVMLVQNNPTELILFDDLADLTEDILDKIHHSQDLQSVRLDRVMPNVHAEEQDTVVRDDDEIPQLLLESASHASGAVVLEQLEEALIQNTSIRHIALIACHPKIIETVFWGISCGPSNLEHLALELWNVPSGSNEPFSIWEGLIEVLTRTTSLASLYVSTFCDMQHQAAATTMNWPLFTQGIAQNTSLMTLTIETLSWTEQATDLLWKALREHPNLNHSELIHDPYSARVTIRRKPDEFRNSAVTPVNRVKTVL